MSPTAKPSSSDKLPLAPDDQQPTLTIRDLTSGPAIPGGAPYEFTAAYRNPGSHNAIVQPLITLGGRDDYLLDSQLKIEIQDAKGNWYGTHNVPGMEAGRVGFQYVLNVAGQNPDWASWFYLPAGQEADFRVRVTLAKDAPSDEGWIVGYALSVLLDGDNNPVALGDQSGGHPVTIGAAATTASTPSAVPGKPITLPSAPQAPVSVPPAAVISKVKAAGTAGSKVTGTGTAGASLASTGGGSDAVPLAIAGATVLAAGVGTLVVLRRRKGSQA
ncbi:LPXTG cell wall anchor domain-containing protein [Kitasatospora nipponensis]|uniref:LPXTG cell wall anchor domain-containing protein n=1 Tax=Kitasatospora nipponensis TaxID=258049 RepID=UPI0031D69C95